MLGQVDFLRAHAVRKADQEQRSKFGQFPTPPSVARFMASMFRATQDELSLLDAGAGVGSLTAAFVEEVCGRGILPRSISATAYELDPVFGGYLSQTFGLCQQRCDASGIGWAGDVRQDDFIRAGCDALSAGTLYGECARFNAAILNPPYRKIATASDERRLLGEVGIETSNLYAGFLAVVMLLLEEGGELVAITPRSFCNGPYFKPFRSLLLREMSIKRIHIFESRDKAFSQDDILQENIIFRAVRGEPQGHVVVTSNDSPEDEDIVVRELNADELVHPKDPQQFIRIVTDGYGGQVASAMSHLNTSLADLGVKVSTGRVVDFRAKPFLRADLEGGCAPLIYPTHFENGDVLHPKVGRKPNAIVRSEVTENLLVSAATHVLVKRFSAKEERRRVVAALYRPECAAAGVVGFENHLNYFHQDGQGLDEIFAKGLTAFLNSSLVDQYFRQFNGHTQVNATDLRSLPYPSRERLEMLGRNVNLPLPPQEKLDHLVNGALLPMAEQNRLNDATLRDRKIEDAISILDVLGLPRRQRNQRSALSLLCLLDLKPGDQWSQASDPLMGITPMMEWFAEHYGKQYAPNTRETVRRQTMHQFIQAGLTLLNPDVPRAVNSPANVYQIHPVALKLLRTWGTPQWDKNLRAYLKSHTTLQEQYAAERDLQAVPVKLSDGQTLNLSIGEHSRLIRDIIEQFCAYYTPGAEIICVGDTGDKHRVFDTDLLTSLGIDVDKHGKMPDVVVYWREKNWLILIEAVTSHGPVNPKRHHELKELFAGCTAGSVFVTAFPDKKTMMKYLDDIAWETEVWVADSPTHIIHFNGERFLGPYEKE